MKRIVLIIIILLPYLVLPYNPLLNFPVGSKINVKSSITLNGKIVGIIAADVVPEDPGDEIIAITEFGTIYVLNDTNDILNQLSTNIINPKMFSVSLYDGKDVVIFQNSSNSILVYEYGKGIEDLGLIGNILAVWQL